MRLNTVANDRFLLKPFMFFTMLLICLNLFPFSVRHVTGSNESDAFNGVLYAGTSNPARVYRYTSGSEWELVTPASGIGEEFAVLCLIEYENRLYAGTMSTSNARVGIGRVYRYDGVDGLGNHVWTLVGDDLDSQVSCLAVYDDKLYAGTSWNGGRLYRFEEGETWIRVVDYSGWGGMRSAYVWNEMLYLGDQAYDRIGRFDGTDFEHIVYLDGCCIYDFELFHSYLYACAYQGRLYRSANGNAWTEVIGSQGNTMWEIEVFKDHLHMGMDSGQLRRSDGTSNDLVWTLQEGIISMATSENLLFLGTGGEAGYRQTTGIGRVYTWDGTQVQPISEILSEGGVQVLYVSSQAATEIYVHPKDNVFNETTPIYTRFNVTVMSRNVFNLTAWQVKIVYDPTVLTAINAWQPIWDSQYVFYGRARTPVSVTLGSNFVMIGDALQTGQPIFNGSGSLCIVEFDITRLPIEGKRLQSILNITNAETRLTDHRSAEISATKRDGNYAYYNRVNLVAVVIEPVQVLWDAGVDLVLGKATDFNISYYSTLDDTVEVEILVDAPGFVPNSYRFSQSLLPGANSFMISSEHPSSPFFSPNTKPQAMFRFTIDSANTIPEINEEDNTYPDSGYAGRNVRNTRPLNILFVAVRFSGEDGHPGYYSGFSRVDLEEHSVESARYLKATYPLAESEVSYYVACLNAPVNAGPRPTSEAQADATFTALLQTLTLRAGTSYDRVVGVVRANWFMGIPGWETTLGFAGQGWGRGAIVTLGYWKTTPHEIGHTYRLGHSNDNGTGFYVVGRRTVNAQTFMSTGAITTPSAQPNHRKPIPSFWIRTSEYLTLLTELEDKTDPETLMVTGVFWQNGTVELGYFYRYSYGTADFGPEDNGNHRIIQLDRYGNTLVSVGFNVSFVDDLHGHSFDRLPLAFSVPYAYGAKTIRVENSTGHILATKTISDNIPSVHVLSPNGGEIFTSESVRVSWEGYDADGETLVYDLLVSGDGGMTWNPIETGLRQTTYDLTLRGFTGGNQYLIMVIASDGVNTAQDISDYYFTVASFALKVLTTPQIITQGKRANYTVQVTSYGGFNNTIVLDTISPTSNMLVFRWINGSIITPVPNGIVTTVMEVEVTYATEVGNHTIIVSGTSGTKIEATISYVYAAASNVQDTTPPTTTHNYDGLWHNNNFTITLTAIDDITGVAETCYKINGGSVCNVSHHGQPYITIESANNTLEFWSVDNRGNEETPHNVLTEIKLDKTKPTVNAGQDQTVKININVTFNAQNSSDNVGIITYEWDFGDGTNGTGATVTHSYANPGRYNVTLTVRDPAGNTAIDNVIVDVVSDGIQPLWIITAVSALIALTVIAALMVLRRKRTTARH